MQNQNDSSTIDKNKSPYKITNMKKLLLILSIFSITNYCISQSASDPSVKNVLFITIDDMNDWAKPFGGNLQAITPNMESLASKSTIFKNAYCSYPLCGPSRASFMTGLNPTTTGVFDNSGEFRNVSGNENVVTLPQYFQQNGYETVSSGKVFHSPRGTEATPRPGSDAVSWDLQRLGKLDIPFPPVNERLPTDIDVSIVKNSFKYGPVVTDARGRTVVKENTEEWRNAQYIVDYLSQPHTKPFFAACGIYKPHLPLYAPKEYFDMYDINNINLPYVGEDIPGFDDLSDIFTPSFHQNFYNEVLRVNAWKEFVMAYLACLTFADDVLGHVLDGLDNSAYKDNTIIVVMGDHGWSLGEKKWWKKQNLWEEGTKTPLIIYDPSKGGTAKVSTRVVSLVDVYPTLVSLSGLPAKAGLDGFDLSPLVDNPTRIWNSTVITSQGSDVHALRTEKYRYIHNNKSSILREELYDHDVDPNEFFNLASDPSKQSIIQDFREELTNIISRTPSQDPTLSINVFENNKVVNNFSIVSNPVVNNQVRLRIKNLDTSISSKVQIQVFNMNGQIVKQVNIKRNNSDIISFDISNLQNGHYILSAQLGNKITKGSIKFLKAK